MRGETEKILKILLGIGAVIFVIFWILCVNSCVNDQPRDGDRCDNQNEETCGTVCAETNQIDVCQWRDAILWCDGYTWKLSKTCWTGEMCTERHGYPECE